MKFYFINIIIVLVLNILSTLTFSQIRHGDQIDVKVSTKVKVKENDSHKYNYAVTVLPESDHSLVAFTVEIRMRDRNDREHIFINNPIDKNWGGSISFPIVKPVSFGGAEITWVPLDTLDSYSEQFSMPFSSIKQGDSINMSFESIDLPIITRFWVNGWYKPITMHEFDSLQIAGFEESEIVRPWYLDAKQGYTISPSELPGSFNQLIFLNTIKTYNDSSYSLGWILNQSTRDKYNTYLSNARSYLYQEDSISARSELQAVLNECIIDSSTVLTSEAFALLYFNTEYLIKQLPEINIAEMLENLITRTNQSYDNEWLDNSGIQNSLISKLENATRDLESGNYAAAKNVLEAYQNEVAAQRGKHITAEGYEFLYYYCGYMIERLQ